MIVTKTPLRISFFGGGTDIERFWSSENGCVLSCTINKFIYVLVKESYDGRIHIKSFEQETVDCIYQIKHDLVREALIKVGLKGGIEIVILSDIPHTGSGLGSSSSLTVGLLKAFYEYMKIDVTADTLARQACEIEIDILGKPIGKQDQYIAVYGGLRVLTFKPDGMVDVMDVEPGYDVYGVLKSHFLLFYTGIGRKAECILKEQTQAINHTRPLLKKMKDQVPAALEIIMDADMEKFGQLMYDGWIMKKQLASNISNDWINELVQKAFDAGASAAKITGAGGGGFLLVFCEPYRHKNVRLALKSLKEYDFRFEREGTKVLFCS
ncbi:MAG: GHMP kinase [Bacillota bacterium]|nr:GHMP kinase [Bacillota bacterium]